MAVIKGTDFETHYDEKPAHRNPSPLCKFGYSVFYITHLMILIQSSSE